MAKTSNTDQGIPANTRRSFCECETPDPEFPGENTYTNCRRCGRVTWAAAPQNTDEHGNALT
jgi:hypothetical protein